MSDSDTQYPVVHSDALELAALLQPSWPIYSAELRRRPTLVCEGEGGAGGGEGGGGGEAGNTSPGAGSGGGNGNGAISFGSQEEFDRAIGRRLAKERESITKKYGDLDALSQKAKQLEELEAAGQSQLDKVSGERDGLKTEAETLKGTAREAFLEARIAALAPSKGIVDVDLALGAIKQLGLKVEYGDDNRPKDIEGLLDELLKEKPALAGRAGSTGFGGGTRGNGGSGTSFDDQIRQRARR